jgi:hypothetical protein
MPTLTRPRHKTALSGSAPTGVAAVIVFVAGSIRATSVPPKFAT